MESIKAVGESSTKDSTNATVEASRLSKKINNDRDVIHFKTTSPAYKNILTYVEALSDLIQGSSNKQFNHKYTIESELYQNCSKFLEKLEKLCDSIDLNQAKTASTVRFGHVAFRDWCDEMKKMSKEFLDQELATQANDQLREELFTYLTESFGNRMRIDYGTGHELNFILFSLGLVVLTQMQETGQCSSGDVVNLTPEVLKIHVNKHGWDIHALFVLKYLRLCRNIQRKFRLEPAGSRGVYNMDDFQFLPFLFGLAQLVDVKYISCKNFYDYEQVDMWKNDFIFFEAIDYILKNKRGPFNEHSYTLWCFTSLDSWAMIFRRVKMKFNEEVLSPFPILQHLLFGSILFVVVVVLILINRLILITKTSQKFNQLILDIQ